MTRVKKSGYLKSTSEDIGDNPLLWFGDSQRFGQVKLFKTKKQKQTKRTSHLAHFEQIKIK